MKNKCEIDSFKIQFSFKLIQSDDFMTHIQMWWKPFFSFICSFIHSYFYFIVLFIRLILVCVSTNNILNLLHSWRYLQNCIGIWCDWNYLNPRIVEYSINQTWIWDYIFVSFSRIMHISTCKHASDATNYLLF